MSLCLVRSETVLSQAGLSSIGLDCIILEAEEDGRSGRRDLWASKVAGFLLILNYLNISKGFLVQYFLSMIFVFLD